MSKEARKGVKSFLQGAGGLKMQYILSNTGPEIGSAAAL
jgi:hypothetical protein